MEKIHLEMLGIEFPEEITYEYKDLGYVKSIHDEMRMLDHLNWVWGRKDYEEHKFFVGMHMKFEREFSDISYIFYLKSRLKDLDIAVRGHEETHALDAMGKIHLLEEKLFENQRVKIDFQKVEEKEIKAGLGELYSLIKKGGDVKKVLSLYIPNSSIFKAEKLYRQSIIPEKKIHVM
jgi:hypothetical protein